MATVNGKCKSGQGGRKFGGSGGLCTRTCAPERGGHWANMREGKPCNCASCQRGTSGIAGCLKESARESGFVDAKLQKALEKCTHVKTKGRCVMGTNRKKTAC